MPRLHTSSPLPFLSPSLTITITVDFSLMFSLLLPPIPLVHLVSGNSSQQFSYPALTSNGHPLAFLTGTSLDYRSSQAGTPQVCMCVHGGVHVLELHRWFIQGLQIGYSTGLVTWDTTYVSPGDYSVQLVVVDVLNGLRVRTP